MMKCTLLQLLHILSGVILKALIKKGSTMVHYWFGLTRILTGIVVEWS